MNHIWYAVKENKRQAYKTLVSIHEEEEEAKEARDELNFQGDDEPLSESHSVIKVEVRELED